MNSTKTICISSIVAKNLAAIVEQKKECIKKENVKIIPFECKLPSLAVK